MDVSLLASYHESTHLEQHGDPISASMGQASLDEAEPSSTGHMGRDLFPTYHTRIAMLAMAG